MLMCAGYPPFYSDDPLTTCRKIVNWRLFLKFPQEIAISPAGEAQFIINIVEQNLARATCEELHTCGTLSECSRRYA
jgi:serine/threonine kinase 38